MSGALRLSEEVADALADGRPVVALESTIFSTLGLPAPANAEALQRCEDAIRGGGAVPAVTAVIDGVPRAGLADQEADRILSGTHKLASRDLGYAVGTGMAVGVTTVSASLALAAAAGIEVFATGGIGGVHRGAELTFDVSSDLTALGTFPVLCVSAGAKAFLDLAGTLEYLETLRVPVFGWQTDELPAFYVRTSGLPVPRRVENAREVAAAVRAGAALGHAGGTLVVAPMPSEDALDADEVWGLIEEAQAAADSAGIRGADVTPFILERIASATEGRAVPANLSLAENNATIAAEIATALKS